MFQLLPLLALSLSFSFDTASAQFPPFSTFPNIIQPLNNPNITVSYKSPDPGTCTTVFSTQKQYTGYINLQPFSLAPYQQDYEVNTFFWFFEARQSPETAPLTIWLNGGPGSSSMIGLFQESGPCEVVQMADGTFGTQSRMFGWDRSSNILYIDQPDQVGFSYDSLHNMSLDLLSQNFYDPSAVPSARQPWAYLNGTFSSNDQSKTANTTEIAAYAVWHFLQGWLSAFPQYNPGVRPNSNSTVATGVHLFAESYGGQYGPTFARVFEEQNSARLSGLLPSNSTLEIKLESLGIINGLIDELIQAPFWPQFAYNNTYGIQAIDAIDYQDALSSFSAAGGCRDAISSCRSLSSSLDANGEGDEVSVNAACSNASSLCDRIEYLYSTSGRNYYDIRETLPMSFPSDAYLEYLNQLNVQQSIGARVNYTESNSAVFSAFDSTGDVIRGTQLASLAELLAKNIRVALISGDADYICNWLGGEAVSLHLASMVPAYAPNFPAAGYAEIVVNSSYIGGEVRQYGNLSFSRVYDAGHEVPAYQPETAFTIFTRIIQGDVEIGTGEPMDPSAFASKGPQNSTHTNKVPIQAPATCWVRDIQDTCSDEEKNMMLIQKGVVKFGAFYSDEAAYTPAPSTVLAGVPGTPLPSTRSVSSSRGASGSSSATDAATGVYVATATPTPSSAAASGGLRAMKGGRHLWVESVLMSAVYLATLWLL